MITICISFLSYYVSTFIYIIIDEIKMVIPLGKIRVRLNQSRSFIVHKVHGRLLGLLTLILSLELFYLHDCAKIFSFFVCVCQNETRPLVSTVVLPPEKAEGCESYLQFLHSEDGERDTPRDATKASGKKRISLDVSGYTTLQLCNVVSKCSTKRTLHYFCAFS